MRIGSWRLLQGIDSITVNYYRTLDAKGSKAAVMTEPTYP